jgi:uncharacterized repeat protein (TIGR03806 family)
LYCTLIPEGGQSCPQPPFRRLLVSGCDLTDSCGSRSVRSHVAEPYPAKLSAWRLFTGNPAALKPNAGVIPYDLNTPLFSDYATKYRFVWMPPGTSATYNDTEAFDFPVGTIFSKTFAFPDADQGGKQRIIETRLLVNARSGWVTLPYVWNREQTEATLDVAADPTTVHWVHPSGTRYTIDYVIPNTNQCKGCHDRSKVVTPIGPKARNLNKDFDYPDGRFNQTRLLDQGRLSEGRASAGSGAEAGRVGRSIQRHSGRARPRIPGGQLRPLPQSARSRQHHGPISSGRADRSHAPWAL